VSLRRSDDVLASRDKCSRNYPIAMHWPSTRKCNSLSKDVIFPKISMSSIDLLSFPFLRLMWVGISVQCWFQDCWGSISQSLSLGRTSRHPRRERSSDSDAILGSTLSQKVWYFDTSSSNVAKFLRFSKNIFLVVASVSKEQNLDAIPGGTLSQKFWYININSASTAAVPTRSKARGGTGEEGVPLQSSLPWPQGGELSVKSLRKNARRRHSTKFSAATFCRTGIKYKNKATKMDSLLMVLIHICAQCYEDQSWNNDALQIDSIIKTTSGGLILQFVT
jgi:hypothetical protein